MKDLKQILEEVQDAFFDIPFENSAFQTDAFVVASQLTPGRAYRAIGLRLTSKLRALNESLFAARRLQVDIMELEEKLAREDLSKFDRMRAEIDIEAKRSSTWMTQKLVRDAEVEVAQLYSLMQGLPKYTRESFEAEESTHFRERLLRQAHNSSGAVESLLNMNQDVVALQRGKFGEENLIASHLPQSGGLLDQSTASTLIGGTEK